jgi:hypothetical protein
MVLTPLLEQLLLLVEDKVVLEETLVLLLLETVVQVEVAVTQEALDQALELELLIRDLAEA